MKSIFSAKLNAGVRPNDILVKAQTQATDIQKEENKMCINLLYVQGASEKLKRILRSQNIRSAFYTESNLRKLHCKPKDLVKNKITKSFIN